jgi:hypothetical protein
MKNFFSTIAALFFTIVLVTSCSKPNDIARPMSGNDSKLEFSLDGSLKTYVDVSAGVAKVTGVNVYSFVGTKAPSQANIFTLSFITDSLRVGSYSVTTGVVSFREGNTVATNVSSTDFIVKITSNVNGLINGTFSGTLYNHTTQKNSTCIQGKIENIQLRY